MYCSVDRPELMPEEAARMLEIMFRVSGQEAENENNP